MIETKPKSKELEFKRDLMFILFSSSPIIHFKRNFCNDVMPQNIIVLTSTSTRKIIYR